MIKPDHKCLSVWSDALNHTIKLAGKAILEIYQSDDHGISNKSDNSPLTLADQAAHRIILDALGRLTPDIPVISEESSIVPYSIRKAYSSYWLVDPLDGTKEFIKRNGEFTVNIAFVKERKSVMGLVYVPLSGILYKGILGQGAQKIDASGQTHELACTHFSFEDESIRVVTSRSHLNDATKAILRKLNKPQILAKGSSLKFLAIAEGQAEYYPRMGPTMEWDTAAAQIILEEAGGQVLCADTKAALRYNKKSLLNPNFEAMATRKNSA